ncbi:MAG: hypothetical protein N2116_02225 [Armatimonadetes bacterium]|nr:hypothetical protein [Armatimonadota bacterium]
MPLTRKFRCLFLTLPLAILSSVNAAQSPPQSLPPPGELISRPQGKVIVFVMDGLSYRHVLPQGLSAFGEIGEWLERNGGMALLNTMGYGGSDRFRAAMTVACGVRAFANESAALVLQIDEPFDTDTARNAYRRRVGDFPLPHACEPFETLVFPMLAELKWSNERVQKKPLTFGIVARSLRQHGLRIVGIGCGDLPASQVPQTTLSPFRHGLLLALDENGLGMGLTNSKLLRKHPMMPYGLAVDEKRWREVVFKAWQVANVVVLFPGETFRADLYGSERLIPFAIQNELNLLRPVIGRMDLKRDLLIVFSLAPSQRNRYELSFICAAGKGVRRSSLLTSLTTRRAGLVSILDIPATVLHFFGVEPLQPINGSPINSLPKTLDKTVLWQMGSKAQATDAYLRTTLLVSWCVFQVIVFGTIALFTLRQNFAPTLFNDALVLLAFLTAGLHLVAGLTPLPALFAAIAVAILFGVAKALGKGRNESLVAAIVFAVAVFAADAIGLLPLSVDSPFGYSSFFGGRYYGQGNVAMGLTLGSIFALAIALNWQKWLVGLSCFVGTILVGAPFFGANVGGALTGIVVALTATFSGRFRLWHLAIAALAIAVSLGGLTAFELMRPEPLTHWGRFVQSVAQGGTTTLASMVWTKLAISFRVFRAVHWDLALLAQLALLTFLWLHLGRDWRLKTLLAGTIASLVFNDSGPQTPVAFAFFPLCVLTEILSTRLLSERT